ncbi:hypothetical protein B0A49_02867 [Cryomyces minteri]|uniref:Uncharacterized protein n=1 Tax=Cryomyces minteri TaxID=331657 RepID=A0A4V5NIE1_9PEZI|nr:hypothetical protein B0A49_02867 [Cryomyces minteri]
MSSSNFPPDPLDDGTHPDIDPQNNVVTTEPTSSTTIDDPSVPTYDNFQYPQATSNHHSTFGPSYVPNQMVSDWIDQQSYSNGILKDNGTYGGNPSLTGMGIYGGRSYSNLSEDAWASPTFPKAGHEFDWQMHQMQEEKRRRWEPVRVRSQNGVAQPMLYRVDHRTANVTANKFHYEEWRSDSNQAYYVEDTTWPSANQIHSEEAAPASSANQGYIEKTAPTSSTSPMWVEDRTDATYYEEEDTPRAGTSHVNAVDNTPTQSTYQAWHEENNQASTAPSAAQPHQELTHIGFEAHQPIFGNFQAAYQFLHQVRRRLQIAAADDDWREVIPRVRYWVARLYDAITRFPQGATAEALRHYNQLLKYAYTDAAIEARCYQFVGETLDLHIHGCRLLPQIDEAKLRGEDNSMCCSARLEFFVQLFFVDKIAALSMLKDEKNAVHIAAPISWQKRRQCNSTNNKLKKEKLAMGDAYVDLLRGTKRAASARRLDLERYEIAAQRELAGDGRRKAAK